MKNSFPKYQTCDCGKYIKSEYLALTLQERVQHGENAEHVRLFEICDMYEDKYIIRKWIESIHQRINNANG